MFELRSKQQKIANSLEDELDESDFKQAMESDDQHEGDDHSMGAK